MSEKSRKSERTILIYGLSGKQMLSLAMAAKEAGIRCRAVADTETCLTVSQLLSGEELPPCAPLPLTGKYALLDGFDGNLGEAASLINHASYGVIKAIRTDKNSSWRFADLCYAIQQEQDAIAAMQKEKK